MSLKHVGKFWVFSVSKEPEHTNDICKFLIFLDNQNASSYSSFLSSCQVFTLPLTRGNQCKMLF